MRFSLAAFRRDAPVSFSYAACIPVFWLAELFWTPFLQMIVLSPPEVLGGWEIWRLATYPLAHSPASLFHPIAIMALIAFFGWYVEPALSRRLTLVLLFGSAIFGGLGYVAIEPIAMFIGGAFVVVGYATTFTTWAFRSRKVISRRRRSTATVIGSMLLLYVVLSPSATFLGSISAGFLGILVGLKTRIPRVA